MINKESWMQDIITKLQQQFGKRLLFVGLQGSYNRNEETTESDFDVVVVFDELSISDLSAYRSIIKTMPCHEKACGFVCGKTDVLNWPKHEIFQLHQDTKSYYGDLDSILPNYNQEDIRQSVKIASANLYHAACHQYLYENEDIRAIALRPLYKSTFFILQLVEYLRSGDYHSTKSSLHQNLAGEEKKLLEINVAWEKYQSDISHNTNAYYERLINWCKEILHDV